jgi:hypothetical protein
MRFETGHAREHRAGVIDAAARSCEPPVMRRYIVFNGFHNNLEHAAMTLGITTIGIPMPEGKLHLSVARGRSTPHNDPEFGRR